MEGSISAVDLANLIGRSFTDEDNVSRSVVADTLDNLQKQPSFTSALLSLVCDANVPFDVRLASASIIKTTIGRYWTLHEGYIIQDSEKNALRRDLMNVLLNLPDSEKKVLNMIEAAIVLIVHEDFPFVWTSAITDLLGLTENPETRVRGLSLFFRTVRLIIKAPDILEEEEDGHDVLREKRSNLGNFADQIFNVLSSQWATAHNDILVYFENVIRGGSHDNIPLYSGECSKLSLSTIRLLFNRYMDRLSTPTVTQYLIHVAGTLETSVKCKMSLGALNTHSLVPFLDASIKRILKLLIDAVHYFPLRFITHAEPFIKFSMEEINVGFNMEDEFWSKYIINQMYFISEILQIQEFTSSEEDGYISSNYQNSKDLTFDESIKFGRALCQKYFSDQHLLVIFDSIATKYLILTSSQLEVWEEDPEEILVDTFTEGYSYNIAPASEFLLIRMLRHSESFQASAAHTIEKYLQKIWEKPIQQIMEQPVILAIESYYTIFAIFGDEMDATTANFKWMWVNMIYNNYSSFLPKYVKRRVCDIIKKWSDPIYTNKLELSALEILHDAFNDKDIVTQVYAALAFKSMLNNFDYKKPQCEKYIAPFITNIIGLVDRDSAQATVFMLKTISAIISKVRESIRPHTQVILDKTSVLWEDSKRREDAFMMAGVIRIITALIVALVGSAIEMEPIYVPILSETLDMNRFEMRNAYYVIEEAMRMWLNCIQQAPFITPDVSRLFGFLEKILNDNYSDPKLYKLGMKILEAYLIVGKQGFIKTHGLQVMSSLKVALSHKYQNKILCDTIHTMQTLIRLFPKEFPDFLNPILSDLFNVIVDKNCPCGTYDPPCAFSLGSCLLLDMFFQNQEFFFLFMMAKQENQPPRLYTFIELLIAKLEPKMVPRMNEQKVIIMVLSVLMRIEEPFVLSKSPAMFELALNFCSDLQKKIKAPTIKMSCCIRNPFNYGCPAYRNLDTLTKGQFSYTANELSFFVQQLNESAAKFGSQWENELKNNLRDPTLLQVLSDHVSGNS